MPGVKGVGGVQSGQWLPLWFSSMVTACCAEPRQVSFQTTHLANPVKDSSEVAASYHRYPHRHYRA